MGLRRELGLEEDFDNTGDELLKVPGFEYAIDFQLEYDKRFRHGANDFKQDPHLTAREVAMLRVMNTLTDKLGWEEKVLDENICEKWGEEAQKIPLMSDKAWEWCLLELRDKARRFKKTGRVSVLDASSRICKSDTIVPDTLNLELRDAIRPLLEQPEDEKDWHPSSKGQVLDLVHPSLFPLVFGKTRVLMDGGKVSLDLNSSSPSGDGRVAPQPPAAGRASKKFQWLPCEVEFKEDTGTDVEITSYINNLHPSNKPAYAAIEKIISLAIPAWNEVLVHGHDGRTPPRIRTYGVQFAGELPEWYADLEAADLGRRTNPDAYKEARRKVAEYCRFEDPDEEDQGEDQEEDQEEDIDIDDEPMSVNEDEIGPEYLEEVGLQTVVYEYFRRHIRQVVHPDPGVSFTYGQWKAGLTGHGVASLNRWKYLPDFDESVSLNDHDYYSIRIQDEFRDEGLQVIVKLASIELTPENPEYAGGSWHIEGLLHEHIVATALYYYEVENLTESRISFRTEARLDDMEMDFEQDDHRSLAEIFGIRSGSLKDEDAIQDLGSVTTPQGRLLTFPNTLQHKVEPFELADKSRPGHRRFLALWLVDPHYRICSTRNVPPQQESWWADAGRHGPAPDGERLMSLEEAKTLRLELMAERTKAVKDIEMGLDTYNFCEH